MKRAAPDCRFENSNCASKREGGAYRGPCGKFCYLSRSLARKAMKSMLGTGKTKRPDQQLGIYRCRGECGPDAWHIGHERTN